ncbi:PREDICTED: centrosomal protein of 83 kDa-like isoform X2 [Priapulus caudatus]|uniref:Centrosomal protein of 83 kDa-like isoform X2 n=1 Tax=Priapulus caudatus TaxID=37621 RepID=A0ABM1EQ96_PRICU|nr:PREDICTED: centrosomal protein of 83 kDa-like isoform X2 [Priapulus caudatus]
MASLEKEASKTTMPDGWSVPPIVPTLTMGSNAAELPRLARETELHKMLADEKMRSERHKTNYQTLKTEHQRLQNEHVQLQHEVTSNLEKHSREAEESKREIEKLRKNLTESNVENTRLKAQAVTPERLELIKGNLKDELEEPYKVRCSQLEKEQDRWRTECNKLRYELSFLKSEYEHQQAEHQRVIEEMKMRHGAEVGGLRKDREAWTSRRSVDTSHDAQRVRTLQRDNAQLHLKVKGLLTELEEINAQREHMGLQSSHVARLQAKQVSEYIGNIKTLQTEKESLQMHVERLQAEVASVHETHEQLHTKLHELEKELANTRHRLEQLEHDSKLEVANLRMENLRQQGSLQTECDALSNNLEGVTGELDVARQSLAMQKQQLVEKEREAERRVQATQEESWSKVAQLENDKLDLESKLQEAERRRVDASQTASSSHDKAEKLEEQYRRERQQQEKECSALRDREKRLQLSISKLEQEIRDHQGAQHRITQLETELRDLHTSEDDLAAANRTLKGTIARLNAELKSAAEEVMRIRDTAEQAARQHHAGWEAEKGEWRKRVEDLESQISQLHERYNSLTSENKQKKKKYVKLVKHLREKLELVEAKKEELEIHNSALKQSVPQEEHLHVKKQLRDIQRRHGEFRGILLSSLPLGDQTFVPFVTDLEAPLHSFSQQQHQQDLDILQQRLDAVEEAQHVQAKQLRVDGILASATSKLPADSQPVDDSKEDTDESIEGSS